MQTALGWTADTDKHTCMNTHTQGGACKGLLCVIRSRLAAVVYCSLEQCVPAFPHCIQAELLEMCCVPVRVCVMLYYVQVYLHLCKLIWAYVSSDVEERQERGICILSVCVCIRVWLGHHVAEHVFTLLWECVCFHVCVCFQIKLKLSAVHTLWWVSNSCNSLLSCGFYLEQI